ncbi:radical SAM family heme chaperone HemW [Aestuariivirga litoralis]|uniref:radical SAM family heme chaperone HemW n=1 Tax=Aestuariivirga litoralis TaxID=2650924 RepID=UPI0018C4D03A|nr:radical SAM family heme chaperone HemW [Aestuariivirga litoralis]MBG1232017.1 coproporphyrinogen III oxidase [Aestuariivirga litoralis]
MRRRTHCRTVAARWRSSLQNSSDFGVYIHWPFCKAKCPYCDFNSHVRHESVDSSRFGRALVRELSHMKSLAPDKIVTSIFFGGGTPSLMPPAVVAQVLDHVAKLWPVADDAEITLEANPTSVEAENFRGYRAAGVNRVSVGVQALHEADLKALGRQHTPDEALAAFRLASQIFPRTSFDLIYARPGQTVTMWKEELTRALGEQQGHMSLYQLTIEPETRYFDLFQAGKLIVPNEDDQASLFEVTQELTEKAGLTAYEVSNHAKPGHESRHNLTYWRYLDYAGVGPGAHGRLQGKATACIKHPETWAQAVETQGHGMAEQTDLTPAEQAPEYLLMGMRINEGLDMVRHAMLSGQRMDEGRIQALEALDLVKREGNRLSTTSRGRPLLNAIIRELNG